MDSAVNPTSAGTGPDLTVPGDPAGVILRIEGLSKRFGGLQALDNVALDLRRGEVHAVVGENGAGKSTMMKILGGIIRRDSGKTTFEGKEVDFSSPQESIAAGIAIIHQELSMLPTLNVIENVFMGRMPKKRGFVDWRTLEAKTRKALSRVGLDVDPYAVLDTLPISQRQLIEIAKAISTEARIIIMDEPNSSLSGAETARLFKVINALKEKDISIIYVSHKIEEVLEIADRITVLRDGRHRGTLDKAEATVQKVIQMMVGRELARQRTERSASGEVRLQVKGLTGKGFRDVTFDLRTGEVLCFSGLVGAGRTEVMRAIFGADPYEGGQIILEGRPARFRSPAEAIRQGFAMVPEDRKKLALFMGMPIAFNMSIAHLPRLKRNMLIDWTRLTKNAQGFVRSLGIRLGSLDYPVASLSGGNQQKTVLARWLATDPKVLILDEPTHGVDVGAKAEIYSLIRELAEKGMSILLVSSELPEVLAMADRVVVMSEGRVTAVLDRSELSEELIIARAMGHGVERAAPRPG